MMIRSSIRVALACAGLGPVIAGWVLHVQHGARAAATMSHAAPWGALSPVSTPAGGTGPFEGGFADLQRHLRLAPHVGTSPVATPPSDATVSQGPEVVTASVNPDLVSSSAEAPPSTGDRTLAPAMRAAATSDTDPAAVASLADQPVPAADGARVVDGSGGRARPGTQVNLNTASVEALNHIPGASNIGRAIVSHRPYRSVEELLSRRVLRSSDFQRVKDKVRT